MTTIINVANRLPVTIGETIQKSSGGLVSALEGVSSDGRSLQWIGWPGGVFDDPAEQESIRQRLESEFGCSPVFLSQSDVDAYYNGFSNGSLWPILHYASQFMDYNQDEWEAYRRVNERFAEHVLARASEGDLVWVHDYHLMLLPRILREARSDLKVGFFLHTPFPSSEVFRCHPRREDLLEGVIGADLIGFHTFGYLRHFRSAVLRALGRESDMGSIRHGNHLTSLGVYPIGINGKKFSEEIQSNAFDANRAKLRETWRGKRIVLGVERLDYSKGILHRLEAIEEFLEKHPDNRDVVFLFVSVPSRETVPAYQSLVEQIERTVGRINGKYATIEHNPIHFVHGSVDFPQLAALYSIAEVAMVTPLVDGMNLVAKEYVACQTDDEPGVLILSEFAGAAQELVDAMLVNPFDTGGVADAVAQALSMPKDERLRRLDGMRPRIFDYDSDYWARTFIDDLVEQERFTQSAVDLEQSGEAILDRVVTADKLAFFLDYDGTLREFERVPEDAFPSEAVREVLDLLQQAPVDVFIISGRSADQLEDWFSDYDFSLIAEHGSSVKGSGMDSWDTINPAADFSWKPRVLDVLRHFQGATPGSTVEEKKSAIVWHYRQADPEYGELKARQLMSELYEMLANFPVEIHHGKKIVEVSSIHVNKGAALEYFLKRNQYDCALCAGDDQTDEAMFRIDHPSLFRIKVGEGDTRADFRIPDPEHFRELLGRLIDALGSQAGASAR